ncbi:MAG: DNA repair exonuclease [Trueperaceae bacterium]
MFRFLHIADLHLGWEPAFLDPKRARERRSRRDKVLEQAVDFALASELQLVVIAGDLFETHRPEPTLVQHVLAQLRRLEEAGVAVVTTPGNHDEITYADSVYHQAKAEWPGLLVINPLAEHVGTFELGGEKVFLYSLAYTGGVTPAHRPLAGFPRLDADGFHLAVFHGTLGSGDERSLPLDRAALQAAGYDYVALGHIHLPGEIELGRTKVVYSGCQEGKGFDDAGVPYWTVVSSDGVSSSGVSGGGGRCEVTREPLEIQRIHVEELDLTHFEAVEEISAGIEELAHEDAMVRLRLVGSLHFPLDPDELLSRYSHRFYHLEIRDDSDSVGADLLDEWAAEKTIRGTFVRRMRETLDRAETSEQRRTAVRALRYGIRAFRRAG